jgi:hypothetical protein
MGDAFAMSSEAIGAAAVKAAKPRKPVRKAA